MMLIEQTTVAAAALPLGQFKDHLRLGTGFADDGSQDALIEALLRAAMAAVEGRTGKVLLSREFAWTMTAWREVDCQALPVAPVGQLLELKVIDRGGVETVIDAGAYRLESDTHRPKLVANGAQLPAISVGGSAEIRFEAGFGAAWTAVPPDLGQAVFLLAAHYHEHRDEAALGDRDMPFGVAGLIERWRTVRILGGGQS